MYNTPALRISINTALFDCYELVFLDIPYTAYDLTITHIADKLHILRHLALVVATFYLTKLIIDNRNNITVYNHAVGTIDFLTRLEDIRLGYYMYIMLCNDMFARVSSRVPNGVTWRRRLYD